APQKKQWSANPQDFAQQQSAAPAQSPVQQPVQQPAPQKKQWSANPQDFAQQQSAAPAQSPVQQPVQQQPAPQKKQWSANPQDFAGSAQGKQSGIDIDSYASDLKKRIEQDKSLSQQKTQVDYSAQDVAASPMKFDGKEVRGTKVNVVQAPKNGKNLIIPIVIVAILIVAIILVAIFVLGGQGGSSGETSSDGKAQTSAAASKASSGSESSKESASAGITVKFEKPDDWGDDLNAYVYGDERRENASWPGLPMTKNSDGTYSYVVPGDINNPLIIFNDGKYQYPSANKPGLEVEEGKIYKVES
ncbi:MAG: starch-binding protein, partial [Clostridia bacterium]|nr:starch-binding protein [Clostridia bacterium]